VLLSLLAAIGDPAPAAQADDASDSTAGSTVVTTSSTSSSQPYIGALFVECTYDLLIGDDTDARSMTFDAFGMGSETCALPPDGPLATASLDYGYGEYGWRFSIDGVPGAVAAGTRLLRCEGTELISKFDDPQTLSLVDLMAWSTSGEGADGAPILPPRLCFANLECDGEPYGFQWKADPVCGDADYDEEIDASDALHVLRTAVGTSACSPVPTSCDGDGDGVVTSPDSLMVLRKAVGLPVETACRRPCLPGTIGPPQSVRYFDVMLTSTMPLSSVQIEVDYQGPGGFIVSSFPPDPECYGPKGGFFTRDDDANVQASLSATAAGDLARCRMQTTGTFPVPADFSITVSDDGVPLENAVEVTSIVAW